MKKTQTTVALKEPVQSKIHETPGHFVNVPVNKRSRLIERAADKIFEATEKSQDYNEIITILELIVDRRVPNFKFEE